MWTPDTFWAKVDIKGPDECWPWLGGRCGKDQICGSAWDGRYKKKRTAHVIAYELHFGVTIENFGCHTCDVPICCNPHHIFDGTQKENVHDMINKGRANFCGGPRKTSVAIVKKAIKDNPHLTREEVAQKIGIAKRTIFLYLDGRYE